MKKEKPNIVRDCMRRESERMKRAFEKSIDKPRNKTKCRECNNTLTKKERKYKDLDGLCYACYLKYMDNEI